MGFIHIPEVELKQVIERHRAMPWRGCELTLYALCLAGLAWIVVIFLDGDWLMHLLAIGGAMCLQGLWPRKHWKEWFRRNVKGCSLVVMSTTHLDHLAYAITPGDSLVIIPRYQLPGFRLSLGGWRNPSEVYLNASAGVAIQIVSHSIEHGWVCLQDGAQNRLKLDFRKALLVLSACEKGHAMTFDDLIFSPRGSIASRSTSTMLMESGVGRFLN